MSGVPITRRAVTTSAPLLAMPYEAKARNVVVSHTLPLPAMCPVSSNPAAGSTVTVSYTPGATSLEVVSLHDYIAAFVGGRRIDGEEIVSMEAVPERLAVDAAAALGVPVTVAASLVINPGQRMTITCEAP
jgi:hypothetical protein